jgi:hypothetical protein
MNNRDLLKNEITGECEETLIYFDKDGGHLLRGNGKRTPGDKIKISYCRRDGKDKIKM